MSPPREAQQPPTGLADRQAELWWKRLGEQKRMGWDGVQGGEESSLLEGNSQQIRTSQQIRHPMSSMSTSVGSEAGRGLNALDWMADLQASRGWPPIWKSSLALGQSLTLLRTQSWRPSSCWSHQPGDAISETSPPPGLPLPFQRWLLPTPGKHCQSLRIFNRAFLVCMCKS